MKGYDPQKAAQVWERVQGQRKEPERQGAQELPAMIMEAAETAQVYLQLARQLSVKEAAALQRLAREKQNQAACLKGICTLMTGNRPELRLSPTVKEQPEIALRRCYGVQIRAMKTYEARCEDAEYGHAFARLAEQQREHCRILLELIGTLGKK